MIWQSKCFNRNNERTTVRVAFPRNRDRIGNTGEHGAKQQSAPRVPIETAFSRGREVGITREPCNVPEIDCLIDN